MNFTHMSEGCKIFNFASWLTMHKFIRIWKNKVNNPFFKLDYNTRTWYHTNTFRYIKNANFMLDKLEEIKGFPIFNRSNISTILSWISPVYNMSVGKCRHQVCLKTRFDVMSIIYSEHENTWTFIHGYDCINEGGIYEDTDWNKVENYIWDYLLDVKENCYLDMIEKKNNKDKFREMFMRKNRKMKKDKYEYRKIKMTNKI
ncbi:hypothetical protein LJC31_08220 [Synergistaceae bacterium OttesenSCG-928-I11]|nr:hypothetical protein [Synergistaceae bacterium OttesenSCG-928-I11]